MNKIKARIIYDQDGTLITILGEFESETISKRKDFTKMSYIDVPYDFTTDKIILGYDIENNKILYDEIITESPEQKRIRELEDALLLQTENEVGGIL